MIGLTNLAAAVFEDRFRMLRGAIIPYEIVEPRAAYVVSFKAWKFMLRDSVLELRGRLIKPQRAYDARRV